VEDSLVKAIGLAPPDVLNRPLQRGFSLPKLLKQVAEHYISRALDETRDNKTQAAEVLGLASYQTLSNWMKKYDVQR
jgi:transcriptional regulator with PAS, ATPase and Fis domain